MRTICDHEALLDERRFKFAMDRVARSDEASKRGLFVGGVVAIAGLAAAYFLAADWHGEVASTIVTSLAILVATVVGRKLPR